MKGLFMMYLYVKYQNLIPHGSKDIAQAKVFPQCDADNDTEFMTTVLRKVVPAS
jgi:hypothetical protein